MNFVDLKEGVHESVIHFTGYLCPSSYSIILSSFFPNCEKQMGYDDSYTVQLVFLGNPTIEKCKKLKKKIEHKKEIEELDLENIISDSGKLSFISVLHNNG